MTAFNFAPTSVLVLAAHTDDEIWSAGTIVRLLEEGATVNVACFSACEESVPEDFDRDVLKREALTAITTLGLPEDNLILFDFRVRNFPQHRQEILESLVKLKRTFNPSLVLLPSSLDFHQDHEVIAAEGLRAFQQCSILGYERAKNTMPPRNVYFVKLEERHLAKKIESLQCYQSQYFRSGMNPDAVSGFAKVRGAQINTYAAEAFEPIRLIT